MLCGPVGCHKPLPGRNNLPQLTETGPLQGQDFGNLGCCCWIGLALLYFCYVWVRWLAHRPKAAEALQGAGRSVVTNLQGTKESKGGLCLRVKRQEDQGRGVIHSSPPPCQHRTRGQASYGHGGLLTRLLFFTILFGSAVVARAEDPSMGGRSVQRDLFPLQ